ncbi:alpha-amlyase [Heyndrickxia sporothermodurans]|uniref:alpha-amylase family glycosyl hydrolase n=1 Tax=Heyndrickxia TaxID=2837504 RepID=UPI000D3466A6|nr:alpha-amylase family glycosyl hydrolase [Heyndrickxia sporothermodurans]PTY78353.1 alpha-amlyase [Heyndrickxia sporothermodurans]
MLKKVLAFCFIFILLFQTVPANAAEKVKRNWQDETIYFLMVDRYNNGDSTNDRNVKVLDPVGFQGGDFKGIIDKLDFIKDQGFTTVMLTPIFKNDDRGYDGYRITDFYKTDDHFGTINEFKKLVSEVHKKKMKIIIDFPTNQVSASSSIVKDPKKKNWFSGKTNDQLVSFDHTNSEVNQYLIDAAKWWVTKTDIDGYLLSNANQSPTQFWKQFSSSVKSVKKDFYLLGEVNSKDSKLVKQYQEAGIDGTLDFRLNQPLRDSFATINQSLKKVLSIEADNRKEFDQPSLMGAFFDNHNMKRYTRDMVINKQFPGTRWKLALTYLYTQPEIPIVYYGTEIAEDSGGVPENRKMMNFRTEKELIDYITMIGEIRQQQPALTKGSMEILYEKNGMVVFKRQYKDQINLIGINNTDKTQVIKLSKDQLQNDKEELRGLISGGVVRAENGTFKLAFERETSEIYNVVEKTGINFMFIAILVLIWIVFFAFLFIAWKRGKQKKIQ